MKSAKPGLLGKWYTEDVYVRGDESGKADLTGVKGNMM